MSDLKYKHDNPILLGVKHSIQKDIYFFFLEASWIKLFALVLTLYIFSNLVFAKIYTIIPRAINNLEVVDFQTAFFFSVQTMSTIGYGQLSPTGNLSNLLVTFEAAFGLIGVALVTGLMFAKISKPYAKIRFSKNLIYSKFDGQYCLSFRIGNIRGNDILEAKTNVAALFDEITSEGHSVRRIHDLNLKRTHTPFFKLTWSIFHPIDESSPFINYDEALKKLRAIVITITGHDGTFSTTVYSRMAYTKSDIVKDHYFKDVMQDLPDGRLQINYEDFDSLQT